MDAYGELSFQNVVHCLPIDIHFEGKFKERFYVKDELVKKEGSNSGFEVTYSDSYIEDATSIPQVSSGVVLVHQGVTALKHDTFVYDQGNSASLQTLTLSLADNTKEEVPILTNDTVINTLDTIDINSSANFHDQNVETLNDDEFTNEVDNAIATLLNSTASRNTNAIEDANKEITSLNKNSEKPRRKKSIKTNKNGEHYKCQECGKAFREKSHLATHSRAHVDIRNFSCDVCGLRFKTKTNLYFHSQTHSEVPFTCTECNKTFQKRKMLKRHIRIVHSFKELHDCSQCDKSFKSAAMLSLHYTLHTGTKPFQCSMCPKSFVHKCTLTLHINQHHQCTSCTSACVHQAEIWVCGVCGKEFSVKGKLNNHMKSHNPDRLYKCNECPKSFVKKHSYETHLKLHTGEGPQYMCDQCSQSYFNVFALRRHYLKHTSQRNFVCEVCSKAFWMKDALKVHMRSHTNEKPYHCALCPKAFAHKHTLEGHIKSHHGAVPVPRPIPIPKEEDPIQIPETITTVSVPPSQQILYYQLPVPLQPGTHIVLTHSDQNVQHTLQVL